MSYHIIASYFPGEEYFECGKCMFICANANFYLTKYVRTCLKREEHSELIREKIRNAQD